LPAAGRPFGWTVALRYIAWMNGPAFGRIQRSC
jgi:hypothetical protein